MNLFSMLRRGIGLLVFAGLLSLLPFSQATTMSGSGTQTDPYQIATEEDFLALDGFAGTAGLYFVQTADLDFSGVATEGRTAYMEKTFSGHYDGQNHLVTGMKLPLFNRLSGSNYWSYDRYANYHEQDCVRAQSCSVQNLIVRDPEIHGSGRMAAFASSADLTAFYNCGVQGGTIESTDDFAAGISTCGTSDFDSCTVDGTVIIGYNVVGGITAVEEVAVGYDLGIVYNCHTFGEFECRGGHYPADYGRDSMCLGGIVGMAQEFYGGSMYFRMYSCTSCASLKAGNTTAGIHGVMGGMVGSSWARIYMQDCIFRGSMSRANLTTICGGLVGFQEEGYISSRYMFPSPQVIYGTEMVRCSVETELIPVNENAEAMGNEGRLFGENESPFSVFPIRSGKIMEDVGNIRGLTVSNDAEELILTPSIRSYRGEGVHALRIMSNASVGVLTVNTNENGTNGWLGLSVHEGLYNMGSISRMTVAQDCCLYKNTGVIGGLRVGGNFQMYSNSGVIYIDSVAFGTISAGSGALAYLNGGSVDAYGSQSSPMTALIPRREGCAFDGWYENPEFSGSAVTVFASGKTYYAKWNVCNGSIDQTSLDFGSIVWGENAPAGSTVTLSDAEFADAYFEKHTDAFVFRCGNDSTSVLVSPKNGLDAGTYKDILVIETADGATFFVPVSFSVEKAVYDMSGVTFPYQFFLYDGTVKQAVISGTLPEGVTVSYCWNDAQTEIGEYHACASFRGDGNHEYIETMTTTFRIGLQELTLNVLWEKDVAEERPTGIPIGLYRNGDAYGEPAVVQSADGWTFTFTELPEGEYSVLPTAVPEGYSCKVESTDPLHWTVTLTGSLITVSFEAEADPVYGFPSDASALPQPVQYRKNETVILPAVLTTESTEALKEGETVAGSWSFVWNGSDFTAADDITVKGQWIFTPASLPPTGDSTQLSVFALLFLSAVAGLLLLSRKPRGRAVER